MSATGDAADSSPSSGAPPQPSSSTLPPHSLPPPPPQSLPPPPPPPPPPTHFGLGPGFIQIGPGEDMPLYTGGHLPAQLFPVHSEITEETSGPLFISFGHRASEVLSSSEAETSSTPTEAVTRPTTDPSASTSTEAVPHPTTDPTADETVARPPTVRYIPTADELQALEAFERQLEDVRSNELKLQRQAEEAVTSLGNTSQVLLGLFGYGTGSNVTSALANSHFSCLAGFGLICASAVYFLVGFSISLFIAVKKIKHLSHPADKLRKREVRLLADMESFKRDFTTRGLHASVYDLNGRRVGELGPRTLETGFGIRLGALTSESQLGDFSTHRSMLIWLTIGAVLVVLSICLMAHAIFCHGDGDGGGERPEGVRAGALRQELAKLKKQSAAERLFSSL